MFHLTRKEQFIIAMVLAALAFGALLRMNTLTQRNGQQTTAITK
jgi:hypothetical protein